MTRPTPEAPSDELAEQVDRTCRWVIRLGVVVVVLAAVVTVLNVWALLASL